MQYFWCIVDAALMLSPFSFFIRVLMANRITLARLVHQSPFSTLIRMKHKIIALDFIKNASFCANLPAVSGNENE